MTILLEEATRRLIRCCNRVCESHGRGYGLRYVGCGAVSSVQRIAAEPMQASEKFCHTYTAPLTMAAAESGIASRLSHVNRA